MAHDNLAHAWKFETSNNDLYLQMQKLQHDRWSWTLYDQAFVPIGDGTYPESVSDVNEARYRIIHDFFPSHIEDFIMRSEETDFSSTRLEYLAGQGDEPPTRDELLQTIEDLLNKNEELEAQILALENELEERDMLEEYDYERELGWDI